MRIRWTPISKRGSPFQNGDYRIPIPKWGSPFWNGDAHQMNPHLKMGIWVSPYLICIVRICINIQIGFVNLCDTNLYHEIPLYHVLIQTNSHNVTSSTAVHSQPLCHQLPDWWEYRIIETEEYMQQLIAVRLGRPTDTHPNFVFFVWGSRPDHYRG